MLAATFVGLLALELLVSADVAEGMQDILSLVSLFGLLVYFTRATDGTSWYWMGIASGITGVLATLVFLTQSSDLPSINPNAWSYTPLAALFALCLALPFAVTGRRAASLLALAALVVACVFVSASRGSMLIAAAAVVYLLAAVPGVAWRGMLLAACAAGAFAVSRRLPHGGSLRAVTRRAADGFERVRRRPHERTHGAPRRRSPALLPRPARHRHGRLRARLGDARSERRAAGMGAQPAAARALRLDQGAGRERHSGRRAAGRLRRHLRRARRPHGRAVPPRTRASSRPASSPSPSSRPSSSPRASGSWRPASWSCSRPGAHRRSRADERRLRRSGSR